MSETTLQDDRLAASAPVSSKHTAHESGEYTHESSEYTHDSSKHTHESSKHTHESSKHTHESGELTHQPSKDTHPSSKYTALQHAALAFIDAQKHDARVESKIDLEALRRTAAPRFAHTFGPAYSVRQAPKLQGSFDFDGFAQHLQGMLPRLAGWEIAVQGVAVDEVAASVVVRASYGMRVQGAQESVENDVVWWLELEEGSAGEGWRVSKSSEMVDMGAAGRIRELMAGTDAAREGNGLGCEGG